MRGVDTNILVRFLLGDDRRQAEAARLVVRQAAALGEPLVVSLLTVLETEWVLRSHAGAAKADILHSFKFLLETREFAFEGEDVVENALLTYENGNADFADCLMIALYQRLGCTTMLTFDARAARLPGGELLET